MAFGLHGPSHTPILLPSGAKMFEGGSLKLTGGQVGIFDLMAQNGDDGIPAVTSLKGFLRREKRFEIRQGAFPAVKSRSYGNGSSSTFPFAIEDIEEVRAYVMSEESKVDIVTLGYNGINPEKAIRAKKGDRILVEVDLKGRQLEFYGFPDGEASFQFTIVIPDCNYLPNSCGPECDPCEMPDIAAAVKEAIDGLIKQPVAGGYAFGDFVKVTPIIKYANGNPDVNRTEKNINFYCIEMCDLGNQNALAELQAQYPGLLIKRTDRNGSISKYVTSAIEGTLPAPYKQTFDSIVKGCEACLEGYTEEAGGYAYGITLEDDGADASEKVQAIANAVQGSARKFPGQIGGVGVYSVLTSKKLTKEEIDAFVEANPTATIAFTVKTKDFCKNPTINTIAWKACGSCKVSADDYVITLPDTACGNGRLEELQQRFPSYNVVAYDDVVPPAGCQRMYKCTVPTSNMVCEECDEIYKDFYRSNAPEHYMGRRWTKLEEPTTVGNDLVGIRFEGKKMEILPDVYEMEDLAYAEDSMEIVVSASLPDEVREAIPNYDGYPLAVEYQQRKFNQMGLGGHMWQDQEEWFAYFRGHQRHKEKVAQYFMGEENMLEPKTKYALYTVVIANKKFAGGEGQIDVQRRAYDFFVPVGGHEGIEEMVNVLGTANGLDPVHI